MQSRPDFSLGLKLTVLLLPLLLFTGCAVLTVDVDVYKGALSNEADVQTKQLAGIIMASERLLIDFTNQLEDFKANSEVLRLQSVASNLLELYADQTNNTETVKNLMSRIDAIQQANKNLEASELTADHEHSNVNTITNNLAELKPVVDRMEPSVQEEILNYSNTVANICPVSRAQLPSKGNLAIMDLIRGASGFNDARLTNGLDRIISNYLNNSVTETIHPEPEANHAELLVAAVDFGEKVKFWTDNQPDEYFSEKNPPVQIRRLIRFRMQTLQAIGNSILSLADTIRQRDAFEDRQSMTNSGGPGIIAHNARSLVVPRNSQTSGAPNSLSFNLRQVQDMVVEQLQDDYLTATLNHETNKMASAKAALDLATSQREDNMFILPSMDYLRNSYPATSLQKGDGGLWHNMLDEQTSRSLLYPFNDWIVNGDPPWGTKRYDTENSISIDKQFWQNINRIRVAGSGITSYVITKDDIGNWYVKSYSIDPTPIIQGAQSLALASAAPASLTHNLPVTTSAAATSTNVEPALLSRELNIVTTSYSQKTLEDGTNILTWSQNVVGNTLQALNGISIFGTNSSFASTTYNTNPPQVTLVSQNLQSSNTPVVLQLSNGNNLVSNVNAASTITNFWLNPSPIPIAANFTNNLPGLASAAFTNSSVLVTNYQLAFTNTFTTNLIVTSTYSILVPVTSGQKLITATQTNAVATNVTLNFATSFMLTNVSSFTAIVPLTNLDIAYNDTVTNIFAVNLTAQYQSNLVQTIINTFSIAIANPPQTATNYTFSGIITNVLPVSFVVTNQFAITTTNFVNHPGIGPALAANSTTNVAFLTRSYSEFVSNAVVNLGNLLTNQDLLTTNAPAIASQELKVLDQWNQLVERTALTGSSNDNQVITQYIVPVLRSLVKTRLQALKDYEAGLNLLGQSQQPQP